ncbi:Lipid A export ATP-binding/permease protein MsbA (plasmid) [Asticcacaulis sp. MM231]
MDLLFRVPESKYRSLPAWLQNHAQVAVPLCLFAIGAVRVLAQVGLALCVNTAGHTLVGRLQSQLSSRLIEADLKHLRKNHSGQLLSSILFDTGLMREAATNGFVYYVQHLLIVAASLFVMISIDWRITLVAIGVGPLVGYIFSWATAWQRLASDGAMTATASLSERLKEAFDGIKIIKINNRQAAERARIDAIIAERSGFMIKGANTYAVAAALMEAMVQAVIALVFAYVGWQSHSQNITLSGFLAFTAALALAGQSMQQLASLQTVMIEGLTAADKLFAILDVAPTTAHASLNKTLRADFRTIEFQNVSFAYDGKPVIKDLSFTVERGQSVAIVGQSGAGKSTLLNLLARFDDLTGGRIQIDDVDHRDYTLASLRDQMSFVTQETFLFDDTISANIAYGRSGSSPEDIRKAAEQASAHAFIEALPKGYDTRVGEAGVSLSGGQRQRIAIARSFLKNAPLLLLDEASSSLDSEAEWQVQQALQRLMVDRTTFIVAHRLSTVRNADEILVLSDGSIAERGTHSLLMEQKGLYSLLAKRQFS